MKPAKRIRPRHLPLLEMFLNEYEAMRQKMDAEAMPALLEIAPLIFGKWYHSALVAETKNPAAAQNLRMSCGRTPENREQGSTHFPSTNILWKHIRS